MIAFDFMEMSLWYERERDNTDYFQNDPNIFATFLFPSEKYENVAKRWLKKNNQEPLKKNEGYQGAFIKQNIDKKNIRRVMFLNQPSLSYTHGLHVVKQDDENIFFVFPSLKTNHSNETILAADHYSMPYIPKKRETHMHLTYYVPNPVEIDRGSIVHANKTIVRDGVLLPEQGYDTDVFNPFAAAKRDVLDLTRAYAVQDVVGGGVARARKSKTSRKKSVARKNNNMNISKQLENALLLKKVKRVAILGIQHQGEWHCTVEISWRRTAVFEENASSDFTFKIQKNTWAGVQRQLMEFFQ
jgi:hypothetical protein